MKPIALPSLRTLDAFRVQPVFLILPVLTVAGSLAFGKPESFGLLMSLMVACAFGVGLITLEPGRLLPVYFGYLMFEGMLKIVTNYNPLVRFGSDILLALTFGRLLARYHAHGNPDLAEESRTRFTKLIGFFTLFWIWIAVQFVNPSSLGLIPSLAGLKVYLVPAGVFFAVVIMARDEELKRIPRVLFLLGVFQAVFSLIDWYKGATGLPSLHPRYAAVLWDFLKGFPYRPFGTTNLPGAPALWMFHCLFGALLTLSNARQDGKRWPKILWNTTFVAYLVLAISTLVACQVRISLIRFVLLLMAGLMTLGKRQALVGGLIVGSLMVAIFSRVEMRLDEAMLKKSFVKVEDRFQLAIARLATLQDKKSWTESRGGSWVTQEFIRRGHMTLSGIGLSRMGAASAPWSERINEDRFFDQSWSFSDNLPLALFTEIGIGGMLGYFVLILAILASIWGVGSDNARICFATCAIIFFSGWASEGILFQPDASLFWLAAAYGIRSPHREQRSL